MTVLAGHWLWSEAREKVVLPVPIGSFLQCWLRMAVSFLLRRSEGIDRSLALGWHSLCVEVN